MHETPTVYLSEKLPMMKDLAHRPTREMDVFEMEGLEELMAGKDMYIPPRTKRFACSARSAQQSVLEVPFGREGRRHARGILIHVAAWAISDVWQRHLERTASQFA